MKSYIHISLAIAVLAGVLGISVQAQSRSRQQLRVNVPFAFTVANTPLPAGDYRVNIVNPASDHSVVLITSLDGNSTAMFRTTDIERWKHSQARLMFRKYGDQYFLAQVWMASDASGLAAPASRAEASLKRQFGKTGKGNEMVAVNAR